MDTDNNNAGLPRDKADLIERIEREWSALQQAISQVTEQQMNIPDAGGWSIKDNLAHLMVWEEFMRLHHLQNRPPHEVLQLDEQEFSQLDENGQNAVLYQRHKDRPVAAVLADLQRTHAQVLAELDKWSYADLMKPHYADDPEARPRINWVIGNTYEHYQEHRATIEKLVAAA